MDHEAQPAQPCVQAARMARRDVAMLPEDKAPVNLRKDVELRFFPSKAGPLVDPPFFLEFRHLVFPVTWQDLHASVEEDPLLVVRRPYPEVRNLFLSLWARGASRRGLARLMKLVEGMRVVQGSWCRCPLHCLVLDMLVCTPHGAILDGAYLVSFINGSKWSRAQFIWVALSSFVHIWPERPSSERRLIVSCRSVILPLSSSLSSSVGLS